MTRNASYSVKLADGQSWKLIADQETLPWLEKLCTITGITPKKLNFEDKSFSIRKKSIDPSIAKNNLDENWTAQDCGPVQILFGKDDQKIILELDAERNADRDYVSMFNIIHILYDRAQSSGALPLHAALIERNGEGIAIAAPAGTGKSTCSRRIPPPWQALCDDETLVVRDKYGIYQAHPFPTWSEYIARKSEPIWNIEQHIPLKGLFFLIRSERDAIEPLPREKAAIMIYSSASQVYYKIWETWSRMSPEREYKAKNEAFRNACDMAKSIPAFLLKASLNGQFWEHIESAFDI